MKPIILLFLGVLLSLRVHSQAATSINPHWDTLNVSIASHGRDTIVIDGIPSISLVPYNKSWYDKDWMIAIISAIIGVILAWLGDGVAMRRNKKRRATEDYQRRVDQLTNIKSTLIMHLQKIKNSGMELYESGFNYYYFFFQTLTKKFRDNPNQKLFDDMEKARINYHEDRLKFQNTTSDAVKPIHDFTHLVGAYPPFVNATNAIFSFNFEDFQFLYSIPEDQYPLYPEAHGKAMQRFENIFIKELIAKISDAISKLNVANNPDKKK